LFELLSQPTTWSGNNDARVTLKDNSLQIINQSSETRWYNSNVDILPLMEPCARLILDYHIDYLPPGSDVIICLQTFYMFGFGASGNAFQFLPSRSSNFRFKQGDWFKFELNRNKRTVRAFGLNDGDEPQEIIPLMDMDRERRSVESARLSFYFIGRASVTLRSIVAFDD